VPVWLEAGFWGLVAGGALVVGAAIAWLTKVPARVVAAVMAFGSGVLISTLAFDLVDEAETTGGLGFTALGLLVGATTYVGANLWLGRRGAARRKNSGKAQGSETDSPGSGTAIAIGALLDGVPESVVLGTTLLSGGVGIPVLAAIFISNLPEGLSSSAGMKANGRSARYVFGVWCGIAVASGLAGLTGALLLEGAAPETIAVITSIAGGAILAMVTDTMIPEAYDTDRVWTGLITTLGFIAAFAISRG
jgi:ZIP family zinc transporter